MGKQENILAFLLIDEGPTTLYESLHDWLLQIGGILEEHGETPFDFIQHRDSSFSFVLEHSLSTLEKKGLISQNGAIKVEDADALRDMSRKVNFDLQLCIRSTIKKHSEKAPTTSSYVFTTTDCQETACDCIFTTGYEGKTLDSFMISLLKSGIKTLVDVRCNAVSRKFGFSKKQLNYACSKVDLNYIHMPELGIPTEARQSLKTQKDYDNLFASYTKNILSERRLEQDNLIEILDESPSALMCYEANPMQCHRTHLAKSLSDKTDKQVRKI